MKRILLTLTASLPLLLASAPAFAAEGATPETKKPYPLKTCVVTGEKLGEMGEPHVFAYKDQEIKLCCKDCLKKFNAEPEKYLKKMQESAKAQEGHEGHNH